MFRVVTLFALALTVAGQSFMPAVSPIITPTLSSAGPAIMPTFNSTGPAIIPTFNSTGPAILPTFNSTGPAILPTVASAVPAITPTLASGVPFLTPSLLVTTAPVGPTLPTAPFTPTAPTTLPPGVTLTLPPFLANIPTPAGGFPVCHACGTGYYVQDKTKSVSFSGITFTCRDIEAAGLQGRIPGLLCDKTLNEAVLKACGCDEIVFSEAPSSLQVPTTPPTSAAVTMMGIVTGSVLAAASSVFLSL